MDDLEKSEIILTWKTADDGKYVKIKLLNIPDIEVRVYSPSYLRAVDFAYRIGRMLRPNE